MIVQVDWYKVSGKWYAGGQVDVGDARLWQDGPNGYNAIAVAIAEHQQIMQRGCCSSGHYCIVVRNIEPWDVQTEFCNHFFDGQDFPPRT